MKSETISEELSNGEIVNAIETVIHPDITHLITEDDEPVDNLLSEKQQRLLTESLYAHTAWNKEGRTFIAAANVGIFAGVKSTPIAPDVLLSLDIADDAPLNLNETQAYFAWVFEKMPDVVIEIVSNRKGGEMARKMKKYAQLHIPYYAVFDPIRILSNEPFALFVLVGSTYKPHTDFWMEEIGLGLRLWEGEFEGHHYQWLRWCDDRGTIYKTGKELAEAAEQRANTAEERAKRLAEQLRALGITPEE